MVISFLSCLSFLSCVSFFCCISYKSFLSCVSYKSFLSNISYKNFLSSYLKEIILHVVFKLPFKIISLELELELLREKSLSSIIKLYIYLLSFV